mmetsp:Transcript_46702/g.130008  ORF Transcript_46702/g.130008 Transcript_46702/m.130008 type:complete len:245 (-) Transcript_46702:1085-1819(-)
MWLRKVRSTTRHRQVQSCSPCDTGYAAPGTARHRQSECGHVLPTSQGNRPHRVPGTLRHRQSVCSPVLIFSGSRLLLGFAQRPARNELAPMKQMEGLRCPVIGTCYYPVVVVRKLGLPKQSCVTHQEMHRRRVPSYVPDCRDAIMPARQAPIFVFVGVLHVPHSTSVRTIVCPRDGNLSNLSNLSVRKFSARLLLHENLCPGPVEERHPRTSMRSRIDQRHLPIEAPAPEAAFEHRTIAELCAD